MNALRKIFSLQEKSPVDVIADDYIRRLRNGETVERAVYLAQFPTLATELAIALTSAEHIVDLESRNRRTVRRPRDDVPASEATPSPSVFHESGTQFVGVRFGSYEIMSELGRGGMGRVYKAWDTNTERHVAVKTLSAGADAAYSDMQRISREALAQSDLKHPNIIEIYDVGTFDHVPYLVMELVEDGRTLQTLVHESEQGVPERRAAAIMRDVADALKYSHERQIIHRDIKPSNIMLAGDEPKLTDFGLAFMTARNLSRLTRSGEMFGTLCYIAPEQIDTGDLDMVEPTPQLDIYALGATMYELLTGRPPFDSENPARLVQLIVDEEPPVPSRLGIKLSREIEAICMKCLEKSPAKRYASVSALIHDLDAYLAGNAINATRINWPLRRIRRGIRRRRLVLTLFCLAGLSVAVAAWLTQTLRYNRQLQVLIEFEGVEPTGSNGFELQFLLAAIDDGDVEARKSAITALCARSGDAVHDALVRAAKDPDEKVLAHLVKRLTTVGGSAAEEVCAVLLRDSRGPVAAAAMTLAAVLGEPRFHADIVRLAMTDDRMLQNHGLSTMLGLLGKENARFVSAYLRDGPNAGRASLLSRFVKGKAPPPLEYFIDAVGAAEPRPVDRDSMFKVLRRFTGENYAGEATNWRQWWRRYGFRWNARRCYAVSWAPPEAPLELGDIVWSVDGGELPVGVGTALDNAATASVIRGDAFLVVSGALGKHNGHVFYIGEVDGRPVGDRGVVERLQTALDGKVASAAQ